MSTMTSSSISDFLPHDRFAGTLVGRVWLPGELSGPAVVVIRQDGVFDLSAISATVSALLDQDDPTVVVQTTLGDRIGSYEEIADNTAAGIPDDTLPYFLSPCDLQVIKAAGVTFVDSTIERVIEEQTKGDPRRALEVRTQVHAVIGENLAAIVPGSDEAMKLKSLLIEQGLWSQYLEVGIGPDAEIFTKAPILSAIGTGGEVGVHPESSWNNPEPEIVLAVNSRGSIVGATLGNDVNLRDFEGRSALLLSKAKDNNASCAIGPFIRLFDATFSLDDVRKQEVQLLVEGTDGFVMRGTSSMHRISRDPADLASQTLSETHQYPDGFMLFLGTLFAPTQDRGHAGSGFTHHLGDIVTISSSHLGALRNRVNTSDKVKPWVYGVRALMSNLAARGLLNR